MKLNFFQLERSLFPGQQENEKVYVVLRQHWLIFFGRMFVWLMFLAILLVSKFFIGKYVPILLENPYVKYVNLIGSIYMMFLLLGLLILWVMYYLNVQIITNERIVDIDQHSLLHHRISELHLSRIEDVTAEVKGIFGTFLDYGNVYVQTAGETERFEFTRIPNPTYINKLILDLYEQLPEEQKTRKE